jgi:hypothetical protein
MRLEQIKKERVIAIAIEEEPSVLYLRRAEQAWSHHPISLLN